MVLVFTGTAYLGIIQAILATGWIGSSICFSIFAILGIFTIRCGQLCFQLKKGFREISHKAEPGWFASDAVFTLGMIGTVSGFVLMLSGFLEVDITQVQTVQKLLVELGGGMSVALYTTLAGLVSGLLLKIQYFNLKQGVEKGRTSEKHCCDCNAGLVQFSEEMVNSTLRSDPPVEIGGLK
jgi:hypothetical protein